MKFLKIFLLILLIKRGDFCQIGCLKCEINQKICMLCDFKNFYFLENGLCVKDKIKNCALSFEKSKCEICEPNFYSKKKTCQKVKKEDIIENCKYYDKHLKCILCIDDYFLKKDICEILENPIDHCLIYNENGNCSACSKGILQKGNCLFNKKMIKNEKCYKFNLPRNNSENEIDIDFINLNKNEINLEKTKIILKTYYKSKILKTKFEILKELFPQCKKFQKDKINCLQCKKGYYLYSNKGETICKKSRSIYSSNCKNFKTKTDCRQCKNGFYLDEKKNCKPLPEKSFVKNCQNYNTITKLCKKCKAEYYLKSNKCPQRENYIQNCKKYKKTEDSCKICHYNYTYEKKIKKCLTAIPNCEKHIFQNNSQFCIKCSKNLAPSNNKKHCIRTPLIKNCDYYSSFFKCEKCKEGFYRKNNGCFGNPDLNVRNCTDFEKDGVICKNCPINSFAVNFFEKCLAIKIQNCNLMENHVCMECKDFFFLDKKRNFCREGTIMNCRKYLSHFKENQVCIECDSHFVLENNTCRKKIKVFNQNCEQNVSEHCILCKSGFFPISLNFRENEENFKNNFDSDKEEEFLINDNMNLSSEEVYRYLNTLCQITHFEFLSKTLKFLEKINHYSFKDKQKSLRKIIEEIKKRKDFGFKKVKNKKINTEIITKNNKKNIENHEKKIIQTNNIYDNILLDNKKNGEINLNKKKKKIFKRNLKKILNNDIFKNSRRTRNKKKSLKKNKFDFVNINKKKEFEKKENIKQNNIEEEKIINDEDNVQNKKKKIDIKIDNSDINSILKENNKNFKNINTNNQNPNSDSLKNHIFSEDIVKDKKNKLLQKLKNSKFLYNQDEEINKLNMEKFKKNNNLNIEKIEKKMEIKNKSKKDLKKTKKKEISKEEKILKKKLEKEIKEDIFKIKSNKKLKEEKKKTIKKNKKQEEKEEQKKEEKKEEEKKEEEKKDEKEEEKKDEKEEQKKEEKEEQKIKKIKKTSKNLEKKIKEEEGRRLQSQNPKKPKISQKKNKINISKFVQKTIYIILI